MVPGWFLSKCLKGKARTLKFDKDCFCFFLNLAVLRFQAEPLPCVSCVLVGLSGRRTDMNCWHWAEVSNTTCKKM